ncbi:hypothetical protein [Pontibacillus sp. HMF3514]|nr:hypothetical protein [Pontibacillus sp. HMF3514]QHE51207.1 hypothetical protein GS400_03815 [Pontibacillus sp. HMF3514]
MERMVAKSKGEWDEEKVPCLELNLLYAYFIAASYMVSQLKIDIRKGR